MGERGGGGKKNYNIGLRVLIKQESKKNKKIYHMIKMEKLYILTY